MADPNGIPAEKARPCSSEEMVRALYQELRAVAAAKMARLPPGQTLQATALVHQAYLRLASDEGARWQNRAHFFASAAEAMRRVIVDRTRRKQALRRGGAVQAESFDDSAIASPVPDDRVLEVHDALEALEGTDAELASLVKLRFFAGLSHDEIAALLGISEKTARRQWDEAKLWLFERISKKSEIS